LSTGNSKKDYRLDLLLKNNNDYIVIEMNNSSKKQSIKARYYLYRIAGKKFTTGNKYIQTKNTLIMFNNYKNEYMKNLREANYILNDKENNLELKDLLIYEIYLPNYKDLCYDNCNEIEKKLWLFNCKSFEEMKSQNLSAKDRWIVEELERLSMDDKFIDEYDAEKVNRMMMQTEFDDGFEQGIEQGIEKGIEKGSKETTVEIAKESLKLNIPVEQISKITKLTIEEILNLKETI